MFGYDNLANYYTCNFGLIQHHKYSLNELENMMPWERQTYTTMLMNWLKEENDRLKLLETQQRSAMKSKRRR
jgi:hypothetical protein